MNRVLTLVVGIPFFLIGVLGPLEPDIDPLNSVLFTVASTVFLIVGWRAGVHQSPEEIRFRGWWRTVRVERGSTVKIDVVPYSSIWTWGAESAIFSCLAVEARGKRAVLSFTVGRVLRVREIADELREVARSHA